MQARRPLMKVSTIDGPDDEFRPVTLTLETPEEIDKVYVMLLQTAICEALKIGKSAGDPWWRKLEPYLSAWHSHWLDTLTEYR